MNDRAIHRFDVDSRVQTFGKDYNAVISRFIKAGMAEVIELNSIIKNKYARTIAVLRDMLLPKLLSGELSVAGVEKEISA